MIFNTTGGGTALNFKVLAYATEAALQAATPVENTIGIITKTPITSWIFSAEEPSPAAAGMVWITIGTSSPAEFNALKKNGIQVYPISANQYVGGAWVDKTAKSYQGGEWVRWITYLYKNGDECTDITGGISYKSMVYASDGTGSAYATGTVTKNTDNIYLYCGGQSQAPIATNNKIDVSPYTKLCAKISNLKSASGGFYDLGLFSGLNASLNKVASVKLVEGTVTLDISNITGSYYIAIVINGASGEPANATVHEIWLK